MRKLFLLSSAILFIICGCYHNPSPPSESPAVFSSVTADRGETNKIIAETLESLFWNYESNSIYYEAEILDFDDKSSRYADMARAAESLGLNFKARRGDSLTVAGVNLLHGSGEPAGQAKFYFKDGVLICAYYSPPGENLRFSLRDKNIFLIPDPYAEYEDKSIPYPEPIPIGKKDFSAGGIAVKNKAYGKLLATAPPGENRLIIYEYAGGAPVFNFKKELNFGEMIPIDFIFYDSGKLAVLLGEETAADSGSDIVSSKQINFYDEYFNVLSSHISDPFYTAIAAYPGTIALFGGDTVEFYEFKQNKMTKRSRIILSHWAEAAEITSVSNDDNLDLIVADGSDLYVYRLNRNDMPELVWRTRRGANNSGCVINVCDLNGDGVNEIYITDQSLACVRYAADVSGFKAEHAGELGIYVFGIKYNEMCNMMMYNE